MRSHVPCGVVAWLAESHVEKADGVENRRASAGEAVGEGLLAADDGFVDFVAADVVALGFRGMADGDVAARVNVAGRMSVNTFSGANEQCQRRMSRKHVYVVLSADLIYFFQV